MKREISFFNYFQVCDKFYFCVDGLANEIACPDSLIFDPTKVTRKSESRICYFYFFRGTRSDITMFNPVKAIHGDELASSLSFVVGLYQTESKLV